MYKISMGLKIISVGVALGYVVSKYLTKDHVGLVKDTMKRKYDEFTNKIDDTFSVFKDSPQLHDETPKCNGECENCDCSNEIDPRLDIQFLTPIGYDSEKEAMEEMIYALRLLDKYERVTYYDLYEHLRPFDPDPAVKELMLAYQKYGWVDSDDFDIYEGSDAKWYITNVAPIKLDYTVKEDTLTNGESEN